MSFAAKFVTDEEARRYQEKPRVFRQSGGKPAIEGRTH